VGHALAHNAEADETDSFCHGLFPFKNGT
jgi:hypothetical protein